MTVFMWNSLSIIGAQIVGIILLYFFLSLLVRLVVRSLQRLPAAGERRKTALYRVRRSLQLVLTLLALLLIVAALGWNGYLIYSEVDLVEYYEALLARIPPDAPRRVAIGLAITLGAVVIGWVVRRVLSRVVKRLHALTGRFELMLNYQESITLFFEMLDGIQRNAVWLFVAALATGWIGLPQAIQDGAYTVLRIYLIVATGRLVVQAIAALVDGLDTLSRRYVRGDTLLATYEHMRGLVPLLRRTLEMIVYAAVASLVLLQIGSVAQLARWGPPIVQTLVIVFLTRVVVELSKLLVDRLMVKGDVESQEALQRQLTVVPLVKGLLRYIIYFVAFVLILGAFDLNPTPILAGAGVVTIVVGLGAQPLINDIVSGFFILLENLFLVGDYIETGTARGVVEAIDIRTTRIRDPNGQQHILRNGMLGEVVNFSKGYTYAVVEVGVAYDTDLRRLFALMLTVGESIAAEHPEVLAPTEIQGLENFGASELLIRTRTRVKPGTHRPVARELRLRFKEAFDREGIEIPFSQHVLHLHPSSQPLSGPSAMPATGLVASNRAGGNGGG